MFPKEDLPIIPKLGYTMENCLLHLKVIRGFYRGWWGSFPPPLHVGIVAPGSTSESLCFDSGFVLSCRLGVRQGVWVHLLLGFSLN